MERAQEQKLSDPSTPVIDNDALYMWAVHESDIREQGADIAGLKEQVRRMERALSSAVTTRSTRRSAVGWTTSDDLLGRLLETKVRGSNEEDYVGYSKWSELQVDTIMEQQQGGQPAVALWAALQLGSVIMLFTAIGSLAFWLLGSTPILNPFASLLAMVASPFAYMMGAAARRP